MLILRVRVYTCHSDLIALQRGLDREGVRLHSRTLMVLVLLADAMGFVLLGMAARDLSCCSRDEGILW